MQCKTKQLIIEIYGYNGIVCPFVDELVVLWNIFLLLLAILVIF